MTNQRSHRQLNRAVKTCIFEFAKDFCQIHEDIFYEDDLKCRLHSRLLKVRQLNYKPKLKHKTGKSKATLVHAECRTINNLKQPFDLVVMDPEDDEWIVSNWGNDNWQKRLNPFIVIELKHIDRCEYKTIERAFDQLKLPLSSDIRSKYTYLLIFLNAWDDDASETKKKKKENFKNFLEEVEAKKTDWIKRGQKSDLKILCIPSSSDLKPRWR